MKIYFANLFFGVLIITTSAFAQQKIKAKDEKVKVKSEESTMNAMKTKVVPPLDTLLIERVMGVKGKGSNGEYKVTIPQNDLSIIVDNFKIIPAMGLGTWIAFTPSADGAMVMGDIVLTETDLKPVQWEVIKQGLTITAIHNHFVRNHPNVMYMHIGGSGPIEQIAEKAKAVLDKVKEVRGRNPAAGAASLEAVPNTLDTKRLDYILGY